MFRAFESPFFKINFEISYIRETHFIGHSFNVKIRHSSVSSMLNFRHRCLSKAFLLAEAYFRVTSTSWVLFSKNWLRRSVMFLLWISCIYRIGHLNWRLATFGSCSERTSQTLKARAKRAANALKKADDHDDQD